MKIRFQFLLAVLVGSLLSGAPRADSLGNMANSFMDMMDSMAEAYSRYRGENGKGYSWGDGRDMASGFTGMPGMTSMMPGMQSGMLQQGFPSFFPYLPGQPAAGEVAEPTVLEGWWLGQSGEVLAFRRNRFRIYVGPEDWREGSFEAVDWKLTMADPETGRKRHYEFALMDKYLALRSETGDILYYIHVEG